MDSGLGSSSVEDVAAAEAPVAAVSSEEQSVVQQQPDCCQVVARAEEGGDCAKCGETRQLNVGLVEELNLIFEGRVRIVEQHGNDIHYKIELYEDWVKQLRLLNLELVEAIKDMQDTCSSRLELMRANYKKNLTRFGPETLRKLESDKNSLIEVIRRAADTGKWDMSGIKLCDVTLDQLFGKNVVREDAPSAGKIEGPTIAVSLEVSSNCQLENTKVDELLQELDAKERQIKHLEYLLEQQSPVIRGNSTDMESDFQFEDSSIDNEPLINQLRQLICKKDQELQQKSTEIDELCLEVESLKNIIEEKDLSAQMDSELSQSLAEFKTEDADATNRKLLQQLQQLSHVKSEQLDAVNRENVQLRKDVACLQAKNCKQSNRDNESLINEIKDHHDKNCHLERQLREAEVKLRDATLAINLRQEVIDNLRRDKASLKKSIALAAAARPAFILQKSISNPNIDTVSICSSESTMSFSSVNSDSSCGTVKALETGMDSAPGTESIQQLRKELCLVSEQLQLFQQANQDQQDTIAEQYARLNASEAELKILRNDYENNAKKLCFIREEIMRLIEEIVKKLKGHITLPAIVQSIEAFESQPLSGNNSAEDDSTKDAVILERLERYLDAILNSYIIVTKERKDLFTMVDLMRKQIADLQREKEQCESLINQLEYSQHIAASEASIESMDKETSIDFDIMPVPEDTRETLAAQRIRVETVLHDMAKEIAYLIGTDLSSDTLSSFSELDATPLHFLITDLKKEIETKDQVLNDRQSMIEELKQEVLANEKELHRLQLRQNTFDSDRLSYEKRIANLQQALRDHDGTITSLKQYSNDLEQHLEDTKDILKTCRESNRRMNDEKANLEDECKNQLITISNLRTALEETKRNGSSSVSKLQEVIESLQSEVTLLGEQLNQAFRENLSKDNELDHYRDSNLHLRCQITDLTRDLQELKDITLVVDVRRELEEQKHRHLALLKNEMNGLQSQMAELKNEIDSRQRDCGYLTYFRDKCAELEMEHQQELQRMRSEIEALSAQLVDNKDTNIQHEQLLRESNALQNTILELSNHNEILQKAIQTYQEDVEKLQQELSTTKFQFTNLNQELENQKALCSEKDSKIISINAEREKLLADFNLSKRMCKCGFNNNLKERSKTPVSHSLQKQVVQKTLEATKAADALKQRTVEFKKLENQYVEERIRLTEQTTELFTQIGKLKGKNSNLEQSLFHKEELIDRLRQNLQEVSERLMAKSEIAQTMEAKNSSLSQAWEKFREDSTAREKRLAEELNSIKRNSQNQRNQLQQCENQLAWHRDELDKLRGKAETLLKERDALRQDAEDLGNKLSRFAGKESALCEILKKLQEDLSVKTGRLAEVEDNYRKLNNAYQNLKGLNEDLSKQYQAARNHLENYKNLIEFKRQTIHTVELARKCAQESRQRERAYEQKVADQKRIIIHLQEDRVKLMEKMQDYHRDSLILNRRLEDYQQSYDDGRRNLSTSLHRTFYPSEANKLVRSSSDPNCKESDELLRKLQYTRERIHRTREFWYRGIKEILPPEEERSQM